MLITFFSVNVVTEFGYLYFLRDSFKTIIKFNSFDKMEQNLKKKN